MHTFSKWLVGAAIGASALACGGSDDDSFNCLISSSSTTYAVCSTYSNVPSDELSAAESACTSAGSGNVTAAVAASCPSTGLDGCCTQQISSSDAVEEDCYYNGTPSSEQASCQGTWSATR